MLIGEKAAGAELKVIVDDETGLEIILFRPRDTGFVFGYGSLFLHLQELREVAGALARLEDADRNDEPLELLLVIVVVFILGSGQLDGRGRIGGRGRICKAEGGIGIGGLGRRGLVLVAPL